MFQLTDVTTKCPWRVIVLSNLARPSPSTPAPKMKKEKVKYKKLATLAKTRIDTQIAMFLFVPHQ